MEKLVIINEIRELMKIYPEYSVGQILYSFTRPHGNKYRTGKLSDLLRITDKQLVTALEKAKKSERND